MWLPCTTQIAGTAPWSAGNSKTVVGGHYLTGQARHERWLSGPGGAEQVLGGGGVREHSPPAERGEARVEGSGRRGEGGGCSARARLAQ